MNQGEQADTFPDLFQSQGKGSVPVGLGRVRKVPGNRLGTGRYPGALPGSLFTQGNHVIPVLTLSSDSDLLCNPSTGIPASCSTCNASGCGLPGSVPALATSNRSPAMCRSKASAISDRALLAVQTNRTLLFMRIPVYSNCHIFSFCDNSRQL